MAEATVVLKKHLEASGNRPHKFIDGNDVDYVTFKDGIADEVKKYLNERIVLQYTEETKGKYTNRYIEALELARPENGDTPPLGTGEYIKGQTAPSDARRMLIRGVQENARAAASDHLKFQTSREITLELHKTILESFLDFFWADALRRGRLMENEDIPFG